MPDPLPAYVVSLDEATGRLGDIETVTAGGAELRIALPASYAHKPKAMYPLLLLVGAERWLGSAIEMTRLIAQTGELRETLVVATPGAPGARLVDELRSRYRVAEGS